MRVALVVPLRVTDDRKEAWDVTRERIKHQWTWEVVIHADSGHQPFNRSASRNEGVATAQGYGADVVVVNDADSVSEDQPMADAIIGAYNDNLMHFPFDEAWYIDKKGMMRVRQRATPDQIWGRIWDKCSSEGGVWVCRPETWYRAGGQDPDLAHWGCDDRAFLAASRTMVGPPQKHPGVLYCLPHDRPPQEHIWVPEEVALLVEYESRYQNPQLMQEFIDARRSHLSRALTSPAEERRPTVRVFRGDVYC